MNHARFSQAERSITFSIDTSADSAFPLFGPKPEMEWDHNWRPDFIAPANGDETVQGSVFVVCGDDRESIWVMTVYDAERRVVEYVRVTPGHSVGQIWISVSPLHAAASQVKVTYRLTGLSTIGSSFVDRWKTEFPATGPDWQEVLNHYLRTGQPHPTRLYDVQGQ